MWRDDSSFCQGRLMENTIQTTKSIDISQVQIANERFYKISNYDGMRPFFMSIVSDSNHWMFISSNGGLSAGRKNSDNSLFPYYTDDKITESVEVTGSKSIFWVYKNGYKPQLWEPFSDRFDGMYEVSRNLYKNEYGNKILFEEVNHDLDLTYRYQWNSSDAYGFVKMSALINQSQDAVKISVVDGIQNILPAGVGQDLQNSTSNLVDAYKRSELVSEIGLGIYALSAIIVDKAEPSEALKANVAWSLGFNDPLYLLSSFQLKKFRNRFPLNQEEDVKAEKGAYFIHSQIDLNPQTQKEWMIVADINKNHAAIAEISEMLKAEDQLWGKVLQDINLGTQRLIQLNAASDGLQLSADKFRDTRHFSNTLFNIMRGGIFDNNYQIEKWDFRDYLQKANKEVFKAHYHLIDDLTEVFTLSKLEQIAYQVEDESFKRLCLEYMPLKFSRRHGDPSRPWNKFSINTRSEVDGSKILDYEGNWRDIFQNWEALVHSYPDFIESMIHKFLNATTFDGYNPYRVTKDGFDWEIIEPDDPWSYIGYWGDHQIIYLLKLLEFSENHLPGHLLSNCEDEIFVYANVPYKIKSHQDILNNPKDTIEFDEELDHKVRKMREELGADGALLRTKENAIHKANFMEKILATVLAKLSNFIPEGGIWMNTQRPEWNDANNALVGNGVSMVTLYYLRRFLNFFKEILSDTEIEEVSISKELLVFYHQIVRTFEQYLPLLSGKINDEDRKTILDELGQAASNYRLQIYQQSFSGKKKNISLKDLSHFIDLSLQFLEHSIKANKREDHLYHAYNLMTQTSEDDISISYLSEMLEGQVAVLSSGYLSSKEALNVLDGLKQSKLFREDQYSYLLYPNKELPLFREKNNIPEQEVAESELLAQLLKDGNLQIIEKDINNRYHFNGNFKNANDVEAALKGLESTNYAQLAIKERKLILQIFEQVFNHKAFTGRSGTFFGYEGLGSIYWHMVSKLQLAVQECCLRAVHNKESEETVGRLLEHYYEINAGIGVHKSPSLYGAFPTDPYSHTPAGKGAQQPGMTGQVKEDILSRFGELGVFVKEGQLILNPCLLKREEFLLEPQVFKYFDVHSEQKEIHLNRDSLCFTYCQVPIVYQLASHNSLKVVSSDNTTAEYQSLTLDATISRQIFERTGNVAQIFVTLNESELK